MIVLTATAQLQYQGVLVVPVVISHSDNTYTHGHMDISIFSLPWHCLQVWTWETFTNNLLREYQHKSPGFWLQQYRYLEWYLKIYTWVKSNQECIWTLDRIPRPGLGLGLCEKYQNNISIKAFNLPGNVWNIDQKFFCNNLIKIHQVSLTII